MAGFILNSQLHKIAGHLVSNDHRLDVKKEIKYLNDTYQFVNDSQFPEFERDVTALYHFEKERMLTSLSSVGYARFRLDQVTGSSKLESIDRALEEVFAQ